MDFEKLQKDVERLELLMDGVKKANAQALKGMAGGLKAILAAFLKDRKEPIRPGQIFRDAAAKNIVPGDIAPRGDALLVRWGGQVTPTDPRTIQEDAARFASLGERILPILKAYRKEPSESPGAGPASGPAPS